MVAWRAPKETKIEETLVVWIVPEENKNLGNDGWKDELQILQKLLSCSRKQGDEMEIMKKEKKNLSSPRSKVMMIMMMVKE